MSSLNLPRLRRQPCGWRAIVCIALGLSACLRQLPRTRVSSTFASECSASIDVPDGDGRISQADHGCIPRSELIYASTGCDRHAEEVRPRAGCDPAPSSLSHRRFSIGSHPIRDAHRRPEIHADEPSTEDRRDDRRRYDNDYDRFDQRPAGSAARDAESARQDPGRAGQTRIARDPVADPQSRMVAVKAVTWKVCCARRSAHRRLSRLWARYRLVNERARALAERGSTTPPTRSSSSASMATTSRPPRTARDEAAPWACSAAGGRSRSARPPATSAPASMPC